jgi:DNA-binding CsgD family transcriptional regulator
MFGVEPEKISQGFFLTTTHPEDYKRHSLARTKLMHMGQELYEQKKGFKIISTNVRARKNDGNYFNALYQAYLFYSKVPYESVFLILIITDISEFKNIHKGFHFYNGEERNFFRFPDNDLLMTGSIFSPTEFHIIELINEGFSSKEIADKLFRSVNTINTHRTNILEKSGKSSLAHVIRELNEKGLL